MANPVIKFDVLPDYHGGFAYEWEISSSFGASEPWVFSIEESEHPEGGWEGIVSGLENVFAYEETEKRMYPKARGLYFRLKLEADGGTWYSDPITPYGSFHDKREWLQAREIMRNENVQAAQKTGVRIDIYRKAIVGPKCTYCTDPVTGHVERSDCDYCYGTGTIPGYYGAYRKWGTFTPAQTDTTMRGDSTGPATQYRHSLRTTGSLLLKPDDVVVDNATDKRYYVHDVRNLMEIRRIPIVMRATVAEAPVSDQIYRLESML